MSADGKSCHIIERYTDNAAGGHSPGSQRLEINRLLQQDVQTAPMPGAMDLPGIGSSGLIACGMGFLGRDDERANGAITWLFTTGELVLLGTGIALLALGVATTVGWVLVALGALLLLATSL